MAGAEWFKVYADTFDNRKVKALRSLTGDAGLVLWFRLLCLAAQINDDGRLYLVEGSRVEDNDLAIMTGEPLQVIRAARPVMERLHLLERDEAGALVVSGWVSRQCVDKLAEMRRMNAERVRRHREKRAQEAADVENFRKETQGCGENDLT